MKDSSWELLLFANNLLLHSEFSEKKLKTLKVCKPMKGMIII